MKGYDILRRIADRRAERIAREGHTLGAEVPDERQVPVAPVFAEPGGARTAGGAPAARGARTAGLLICEVKRRSPSRGAINAGADPAALAVDYARRGAGAVSVLTEVDHFAGSLADLMAVKDALGAPHAVPVLRKDFLLDEEDIDVSYRAGADIVLLIATLLDAEQLARLHGRAKALGMAALVELYTREDAENVRGLAPPLTGINSRDLTSFELDRLHPLAVSAAVDWPAALIYESGVFFEEDARVAAQAGFAGILVGEAVMRAPELVSDLARGLATGAAHAARAGTRAVVAAGVVAAASAGAPRPDFWSAVARRAAFYRTQRGARPLVKICGITSRADAEAAVSGGSGGGDGAASGTGVAGGADILGFIFAESPRAASFELLAELSDLEVLKVAVVVAGGGREIPEAVREALEAGLIDAVQLHGDETPSECASLAFPYYKAVRLRADADAAVIEAYRSPRVLIDAFDRNAYGGTGRRILPEVVDAAARQAPLWMAGGIGPANVAGIVERHRPELIDASSLLEAEPGRKDHDTLRRFFEEIGNATTVQ